MDTFLNKIGPTKHILLNNIYTTKGIFLNKIGCTMVHFSAKLVP